VPELMASESEQQFVPEQMASESEQQLVPELMASESEQQLVPEPIDSAGLEPVPQKLGEPQPAQIISSPVVSDLYNLASAILFEMAFVRSIFSCIVERQQSLATSLEALRETNTSDC